jgi:hypothetical protein
MPCVPGITLPPGDRGESVEPRLSGWLLEVALWGSSLEEKVWRITLGSWERSEESSLEPVATDGGLRTSLEVEELHTTTTRRRILLLAVESFTPPLRLPNRRRHPLS